MRGKTAFLFAAAAACGLMVSAAAVNANVVFENLPLIGGIGGEAFSRECPDKHVLTGIRYRSHVLVDGIGIKCRPVRSDGALGAEINSGTMAGGNGGDAGSASCQSGSVVAWESGISNGFGIAKLVFRCYKWTPASKTWAGSMTTSLVVGGGITVTEHSCAAATQPATGIRGRHGAIVDAVGLHCSTP